MSIGKQAAFFLRWSHFVEACSQAELARAQGALDLMKFVRKMAISKVHCAWRLWIITVDKGTKMKQGIELANRTARRMFRSKRHRGWVHWRRCVALLSRQDLTMTRVLGRLANRLLLAGFRSFSCSLVPFLFCLVAFRRYVNHSSLSSYLCVKFQALGRALAEQRTAR